MATQSEKGAAFAALHQREKVFMLANAWDVGSARVLAGLGFEALATTSAGYAHAIGVPDYRAGRANVIAHSRELASKVELPLSADLENGFGHAP